MLKWIKLPFSRSSTTAKPGRKTARKQARRKTSSQTPAFRIQRQHVLITAALAFTVLAYLALPGGQWLPIEKIKIAGQFRHLDTEQLQTQLEPFLGQGFFSVDIQSIQQMIGKQPWIREVSVRRVWPNQLQVSIVEKEAFARWDASHLLGTQASIFLADSTDFQHLPLINGYPGRSTELLNYFVKLQRLFASRDLKVTSLHEDSKGALSLELDNRLRVNLGSDNSEQKIEQLLAVYRDQIHPRLERIAHIDFRYSNGFAIAWKKEDGQESRPSQLG